MGIWYCTREDVKDALDIHGTARSDSQIDGCIDDGAVQVESVCNRVFYPTVATRYKDYPNWQYAYPWRLWLDADELISLTSFTSGGVSIPVANVRLEPANSGPPFNRLEVDISTSSSFVAGTSYQRNLAISGVFGYDLRSAPAGALAAAINDTTGTTVTVTDSASIGVGSLITVGSERMYVTEKSMLTTGQTLQTAMAAATTDVTVAVTSGAGFVKGEVILLNSERMKIIDIAGNNLTVKRAWDGSVLATHAGSTIYAPRSLTVTRGALGTTAATHSSAATITRQVYPGPVRTLNIAEAVNTLLQETTGYARTVGSGENVRNASGAGLADKRKAALAAVGRVARTRAV